MINNTSQDDVLHKLRMKQLEINLRTGGVAEGGLTVRDYFAATALPAVMKISANVDYESRDERIGEAARISYVMADAMMRERNRPFEQPMPSVEEAFGLGRGL